VMPRYGGPPATPEGQESRPLAQARPPSNDNDEGTLLLRGDREGRLAVFRQMIGWPAEGKRER
ncbi:MAG: hypothetical protein ACREJP_04680, partial [Candidatus Methylomirabilales bacterium]